MRLIKNILSAILTKAEIVRGDMNRNDRYGGLFKAWGYIYTNHIPGDYVEFGIYKGDGVIASLAAQAKFAKWLRNEHNSPESWRREVARLSPLNDAPAFHCLDSFAGMPENDEGSISFPKGAFLGDLETVRKRVEKRNTEGLEVRYYKGLFAETAATFKGAIKGRTIAIANIDCDLMESTADALDAIKSNIDIGTILLFDDYNCFKADMSKGQRKAFADFQRNAGFVFERFFPYHFSGQAFLVIGRTDDTG